MTGKLVLGKRLGKSSYRTVSGKLHKVKPSKLYYHRGNKAYSEYSPSRDKKIKAHKHIAQEGYTKGNPRYSHTGDRNRKRGL